MKIKKNITESIPKGNIGKNKECAGRKSLAHFFKILEPVFLFRRLIREMVQKTTIIKIWEGYYEEEIACSFIGFCTCILSI